MAKAGMLQEDDRVELIGEIIEMSPIGDRHVECVNRLTMPLTSFAAAKGTSPASRTRRLGEGYEPQPDLVVLGGCEGWMGTPVTKMCCS